MNKPWEIVSAGHDKARRLIEAYIISEQNKWLIEQLTGLDIDLFDELNKNCPEFKLGDFIPETLLIKIAEAIDEERRGRR